MRDITDLPHDLFLLVISYLSPTTCVLCRSVSRQWLAAFTNDATSLLLLRWNFPRCREIRLAAAAASLTENSSSSARVSGNTSAEFAAFTRTQRKPGAWAVTFAEVAHRYRNLRHAHPRVVEKLAFVEPSCSEDFGLSFCGVAPWNRFLRLDDKTANFHYPDPAWSFSQEDGVLVYPGGCIPGQPNLCDGYIYQVLDLATYGRVTVPFDAREKHIRRVRLVDGVLVFEWAEGAAYHQLNDREVVHRHFVSAFDVVRAPTAPEGRSLSGWTVKFRSEWKLHFLGLPLNRSDRFFSAHTSKHYAVYFWQPNRSLYQDDPIEQIAVWDISTPSSYKPSEDPNGDQRPAPGRAQTTPTGLWSGYSFPSSGRASAPPEPNKAKLETSKESSPATATTGPRVIRRMAWRELDFYGLRQRATPQLRNLALDDYNLYIVEEEHRWANGQHSALVPPRVHLVRCTGIPIVPVQESDTASPDLSIITEGPVHGPIWVNECGADGDTNMNFCRRAIPRTEEATNSLVSFLQARQSGPPNFAELWDCPLPTVTPWPWLVGRDKRCAPCWRHEDFPYLTVTEMLDADAGVRVTARHCFMLETLSVHVRPAMISISGAKTVADVADDGKSEGSKVRKKNKGGKKEVPLLVRTGEVQFTDDMWPELMAKGHIAGDERWVIGEDDAGRITVVRF